MSNFTDFHNTSQYDWISISGNVTHLNPYLIECIDIAINGWKLDLFILCREKLGKSPFYLIHCDID